MGELNIVNRLIVNEMTKKISITQLVLSNECTDNAACKAREEVNIWRAQLAYKSSLSVHIATPVFFLITQVVVNQQDNIKAE